MKTWLTALINRHLITDDPHPTYSHLDTMDGLK